MIMSILLFLPLNKVFKSLIFSQHMNASQQTANFTTTTEQLAKGFKSNVVKRRKHAKAPVISWNIFIKDA